jgi:hypothetical protein
MREKKDEEEKGQDVKRLNGWNTSGVMVSSHNTRQAEIVVWSFFRSGEDHLFGVWQTRQQIFRCISTARGLEIRLVLAICRTAQ